MYGFSLAWMLVYSVLKWMMIARSLANRLADCPNNHAASEVCPSAGNNDQTRRRPHQLPDEPSSSVAVALYRGLGGAVNLEARDHHRLDLRHPAAPPSASVQNHLSPLLRSILVRP